MTIKLMAILWVIKRSASGGHSSKLWPELSPDMN